MCFKPVMKQTQYKKIKYLKEYIAMPTINNDLMHDRVLVESRRKITLIEHATKEN